jgi:hypothetical protein
MEKIEKIKSHFTDLLQMCKFETLSGELKLSWFDERNVEVNGNNINIDFNLDDENETYGYLDYDYKKDKFCLTIEHHKGIIIKDNLGEDFAPLHNFIEKL